MKVNSAITPPPRGAEFLKNSCFILFLFEMLLGAAHLLWPQYRWGQGRDSYFNFDNSLTLASWLASMQLLAVGILSLVGFHRERLRQMEARPAAAWLWLIAAMVCLVLSIAEMTRFHHRFDLLGFTRWWK